MNFTYCNFTKEEIDKIVNINVKQVGEPRLILDPVEDAMRKNLEDALFNTKYVQMHHPV